MRLGHYLIVRGLKVRGHGVARAIASPPTYSYTIAPLMSNSNRKVEG